VLVEDRLAPRPLVGEEAVLLGVAVLALPEEVFAGGLLVDESEPTG